MCSSDLSNNLNNRTLTSNNSIPNEETEIQNSGLTVSELLQNTELFPYNQDDNLEAKCHICNEDYKNNEICRKIKKCGHYFHQTCIDIWVRDNNTCPICTQSI